MNTIKTCRLAIALLGVSASMPALAHQGPHHQHGLIDRVMHLLSQPDHLAFMVAGALTIAGLGVMADIGESGRRAIREKLRALRKTL